MLHEGTAMADLRVVKLISATLLVCTGAVCIAIGGLPVGLVLLVVGSLLLIRQWTGRGVLDHLAAAVLWVFELNMGSEARSSKDTPAEAETRT
jgi:hypothetical protein